MVPNRLAIFLVVAHVLAQTPPENTAKITGKVTDAVTHRPVPGVHVSTTVGKRFVGSLTAFDGSYTLEDLPDGPARMTLNLDGYRTIIANRDKLAEFPVGTGETVTRDFEMHPLCRIYGKLTDRDSGEPIEGHPVYAMRKEHLPGHSAFGGRSDDPKGGKFDIGNLEPGDYIVNIGAEAEPRLSPEPAASHAQPKKFYGERWYPDVPRRDMATLIHLEEGETRNIEMAIEGRETHTLSGIVEVPHELEHEAISFVFRTAGGGRGRTAEMRSAGSFRIENLVRGTYRLAFTSGKATGPDNIGFVVATPRLAEAVGDFDVEIADHDIENFRAVLLPGAGVNGEFHLLEQAAKLPDRMSVELVPSVDWIANLPGGGTVVEGTSPIETARVESGRFHREPIRPGDYWPLIGLPDGYAVVSPHGLMHLTAPNTPLPIVITSQPGAIAGVVVDGDQTPVRGATVVLFPDPMPEKPGPATIRAEESGPRGAFLFRNLAPGNYKAVALSGTDVAYEGDINYLREHAAKADPIEVRAGQSATITLK